MDLLRMTEDKADEISTKLYGLSYYNLDQDRQDLIYQLASLDLTEILTGSVLEGNKNADYDY